jgi:hypothetical protein
LLDYAFAAKSERIAAGKQITGDIVSYRDPDAALILAHSRAGNSLGLEPLAPASPSAVAAPVGEASATASPDSAAGLDQVSGTEKGDGGALTNNQLIIGIIALAALALTGFFGWKAFESAGTRRNVVIGRESRTDLSDPD